MGISFIVPAYKTPPLLVERCLASIDLFCRLNNVQHEVIVLNDAVVQSVARNRGLLRATKEWVWFVDADDEVVCENSIAARIERTDADILIFGMVQQWGEHGRKMIMLPSKEFCGELGRECIIKEHGGILFRSLCNKVFRRSFLRRNHIMMDEGCEPCEDGMFIMRCLMARAKWEAIEQLGYLYWRRPGSSLFRFCPTIETAICEENDLWDELTDILCIGSFDKCKWRGRRGRRMIMENNLLGENAYNVPLIDRAFNWLVSVRRFLRFRGV